VANREYNPYIIGGTDGSQELSWLYVYSSRCYRLNLYHMRASLQQHKGGIKGSSGVCAPVSSSQWERLPDLPVCMCDNCKRSVTCMNCDCRHRAYAIIA
jgi:hypothetical protein